MDLKIGGKFSYQLSVTSSQLLMAHCLLFTDFILHSLQALPQTAPKYKEQRNVRHGQA